MNMISRAKLDTLVERVIRRLEKVAPPPVTKTGDFRYKNDGTSVEDTTNTVPTSGTAKTQMPSTMHPPTIPAAKSAGEQAAKSDGVGNGSIVGRNPRSIPSQKTVKVNNIRKALDSQGYTADATKAKHVTQTLNGWYDQLDPSDALVATADELALRFAGEG